MKKYTLRITEEEHKRLRIHAAQLGMQLKELLVQGADFYAEKNLHSSTESEDKNGTNT